MGTLVGGRMGCEDSWGGRDVILMGGDSPQGKQVETVRELITQGTGEWELINTLVRFKL